MGHGDSLPEESTTPAEALEKLRLGMHLLLREGSTERNLAALAPVVTAQNAANCSFATDDKLAADLVKEGHIDHAVRTAIRCGVPPVTAFQIATINPAPTTDPHERTIASGNCA